MAWKKKTEEKLLSFSPKKKQDDEDDFDWDFPLEEEEEEEEVAVEEEVVAEEEVAAEEEPQEEEIEEEVVEEEEEEEATEVELDDIEEEAFDDEEVVEEVDLDDVEEEEFEEVEPENIEEVELDDIEAEDYAEEVEPDEVLVEDYEEEEIAEDVDEVEEADIEGVIPVEYVEEESVDRTNIFEHAVTYYDQNTIILPRNFESRIRMASDDIKKLYSDIKNVLMEYSGVKCRMLKYVEVFRCGGVVAKMRIKGKSLYLYLRLDPSCVDHDYLKIVDKSERRGYEETPAEIKVTGKRKCKRSIEMIRLMMDALGVGHRRHPEVVDYVEKYPTPENACIYGKNMVKVSKRSDYVD